MMDFAGLPLRRVDANFAVAPQLQPADMAGVADAGFRTVICNRPDGEEAGQPASADIRSAAQTAGLAYYDLPVSGGAFPAPTVDEFRRIRREAIGPVLAFCRTGTRSITLDTLADPDSLPVEERLNRAMAAGYDLSALVADRA